MLGIAISKEEYFMSQQPDIGKKKALELAISHIQKQFGEGAIMALGKHSSTHGLSVIKTGAISLDIALGIGGVPRGRIVEIYGPESSGKSTLATHIVANAQKNGGLAAYIDAEHALDPVYAAKIGVNIDDLMISQPDNGEEALNIAEMLARSNAVDVIVIDSVAALVPKSELEGEIGDQFMGLQARMMSQALRKLTATLSRSNTCAIFINQIREKIGVMFGNPETTTGGRALKFYASIRMDIRRIDRDQEPRQHSRHRLPRQSQSRQKQMRASFPSRPNSISSSTKGFPISALSSTSASNSASSIKKGPGSAIKRTGSDKAAKPPAKILKTIRNWSMKSKRPSTLKSPAAL